MLLGACGGALIDPALSPGRLASLDLDVVHFPANLGWLRRGPVPHVLTVHDAIFLHARGRTARQLAGRALMRALVPRSVSMACEVVTVSDVAREDLRSGLGVDRHVHVCPHGAPEDIVPQPGPRSAVLVFAASDPRKGTALALEAWRTALPALPAQTELYLLTAAGSATRTRVLLLAFLGFADSIASIVRAGIAARERSGVAAHLIRGGLRAPRTRQAMVGGAVVVGGLAPSVRWLAGDALAGVGGARDAASIAAALVEVCTHDGLASDLRSRGRTRASQFTWSASAEGHMTAYRAAIERRSN